MKAKLCCTLALLALGLAGAAPAQEA